ncbi:unnamed protein product [Allacma fusca]|uniref:Uncharacterized protein n=1 Tax=Allacma fusca TaxID=39272 RepID=A0A8J2KHC2_9HEXA|nr:unnamed protein product [Allacma fusca]
MSAVVSYHLTGPRDFPTTRPPKKSPLLAIVQVLLKFHLSRANGDFAPAKARCPFETINWSSGLALTPGLGATFSNFSLTTPSWHLSGHDDLRTSESHPSTEDTSELIPSVNP